MPVARSETRPTSHASAPASCARIAARCGASLGAASTTTASTLTRLQPGRRDPPPGLRQQVEASRAPPLLVLGREERADVVHAGRAEQRVAERVTDDVGVGVTVESVRVRDLDPAEHERTPGHQAVRVEGRADAELSQAAPHAARGRVNIEIRR